MTLTVHHLQVSQSERIVWLCEELGIQYDLQLHKRDPVFSPPEIKALNPMGAAPVIVDTTFTPDKPLIMGESAAIVEYIIQKHGNGRLMLPPSHPDYADYLYWFHFSNGNLQPVISRTFSFNRLQLGEDYPIGKEMNRRKDILLDHIDGRLSKNKWLAGDEFTAADIMSVFSFSTMRCFYGYDLSPYKNIVAYLQRVGERPAYRKAMEKGDPGMEPALSAAPPPLFGPLRQRQ